jgi:hypothetical protein
MNDGAPQVFALALLLVGMISGSLTHAQEMFKLLSEKNIRARVIGKDITDSAHWVSYLRPDACSSAAKWAINRGEVGKSAITNFAYQIQIWRG